jgi:hypothetical protein
MPNVPSGLATGAFANARTTAATAFWFGMWSCPGPIM